VNRHVVDGTIGVVPMSVSSRHRGDKFPELVARFLTNAVRGGLTDSHLTATPFGKGNEAAPIVRIWSGLGRIWAVFAAFEGGGTPAFSALVPPDTRCTGIAGR